MIWPGALPSILAASRITASVMLLLVVSAEMIGAEFGIGAFVLQAGNLDADRSAARRCRDIVAVRARCGEADQFGGSAVAALARLFRPSVMAGLVPAIHVFECRQKEGGYRTSPA